LYRRGFLRCSLTTKVVKLDVRFVRRSLCRVVLWQRGQWNRIEEWSEEWRRTSF
jgi:hypothetical protein